MPQHWPHSNAVYEGCEMCLHRGPRLWEPSASREAPTSHTVTRNRHYPERLSPHPKAGVVFPCWLQKWWWWVQTTCLRLVRSAWPSHTSICCSGPSFRLFPQNTQTFNTPLHRHAAEITVPQPAPWGHVCTLTVPCISEKGVTAWGLYMPYWMFACWSSRRSTWKCFVH